MAIEVQRWLFTVEDYHKLGRDGFFGEDGGEDARLELIEGEIVVMSPIGGKHTHCINQFNRRLVRLVGDGFLVSVQNPVRLANDTEPQPDLAVVRDRDYGDRNPGPGDVLLLVEVSDSTLRYDRDVKLPLYAAAGIPEVWLADFKGARLLRFSDPRDGRYQAIAEARRGETLTSLALPAVAIAAADVLPTGNA